MRFRIVIFMLCLVVFIYGCTIESPWTEESAAPEETVPEETPELAPEVSEEASVEPPEGVPEEETCEDKAKKLIPATFKLSLASNHDPDSAGWSLESGINWSDGTLIDYKGDIEFRKGRRAGENTNYWYTINNQNEKLFGEGGLKYSKKAMSAEGIAGENEFIIKPVLKPGNIFEPTMPSERYQSAFTIIDYGFVSCEWIE